jgi:hypothetical protein
MADREPVMVIDSSSPFSGPSREELEALAAWAITPKGEAFLKGLAEGKTDFRSPNPEEWT